MSRLLDALATDDDNGFVTMDGAFVVDGGDAVVPGAHAKKVSINLSAVSYTSFFGTNLLTVPRRLEALAADDDNRRATLVVALGLDPVPVAAPLMDEGGGTTI